MPEYFEQHPRLVAYLLCRCAWARTICKTCGCRTRSSVMRRERHFTRSPSAISWCVSTQPGTFGTSPSKYCTHFSVSKGWWMPYVADWGVVCLLAAPRIQLFASADNGWPHNALRYH